MGKLMKTEFTCFNAYMQDISKTIKDILLIFVGDFL